MIGELRGRLPVRTPARPGPGPTPEALLRALDITIGRRIRGLVPGEFRARAIGGGTELAQVRPYEPGDDVRRIDWNVTARMLVPHVRVHVPERSLTTWLVLDESASMAFGTADRRKADVAEGVALALGHLSTQRGNRLGVLTFGGAEARRIPPRGGNAGLLAVLAGPLDDREPGLHRPERDRPAGDRWAGDRPAGLDTTRGPGGSSASDPSPAPALRFLAGGATRGGIVALVSDFRGPRDWLSLLAPVAARHGLLAVEIRDPREDELPDVGDLVLVDAETGREVRVDTSSRRLRADFARAAAAERAGLAAELRRLGARHVVLSTAGEWLRSLAVQLRTGGAVA